MLRFFNVDMQASNAESRRKLIDTLMKDSADLELQSNKLYDQAEAPPDEEKPLTMRMRIDLMKESEALMIKASDKAHRARQLVDEAVLERSASSRVSSGSPASQPVSATKRKSAEQAKKRGGSSESPRGESGSSRDQKRHQSGASSPVEDGCGGGGHGSAGYLFDTPAVYEREKYLARTPEEIYAMLKKYGVAVVPAVLSKEEAAASWRKMLLCLEGMYEGFRFDDKSTWKLLRSVSQCKHAMLFQNLSVGWAQFAVDLRQNPRMAKLFADIWTIEMGTRIDPLELLCAPDGFSCYLNTPGEKGGFHRRLKDSLHSDQAADDPNFSVQSFVNLVDTKQDDAAFHFLERSHLVHAEFFESVKIYKERIYGKNAPETKFKRFTLLENQTELDFFMKPRFDSGRTACKQKCIAAKAGDGVFWLSTTVHDGRQAVRPNGFQDPNRELLRGVVYVCMQPKSLATDKDLKKKIETYLDLRTTTHNAAVGVKPFPNMPRMYGKKEGQGVVHPIIEKPMLTELGYSLFGLNARIKGFPYDPVRHMMIPPGGSAAAVGKPSRP